MTKPYRANASGLPGLRLLSASEGAVELQLPPPSAVVQSRLIREVQKTMEAMVADDKGNYLLLARGELFAVVERRNGRLYNCHDEDREGIEPRELARVSQIVDEQDWVDETTARAALEEAVARWTELAERMR
jgi:hypothetical protein